MKRLFISLLFLLSNNNLFAADAVDDITIFRNGVGGICCWCDCDIYNYRVVKDCNGFFYYSVSSDEDSRLDLDPKHPIALQLKKRIEDFDKEAAEKR